MIRVKKETKLGPPKRCAMWRKLKPINMDHKLHISRWPVSCRSVSTTKAQLPAFEWGIRSSYICGMIALNLLQTHVVRNSNGDCHTVNVFANKAIQDNDCGGLEGSLFRFLDECFEGDCAGIGDDLRRGEFDSIWDMAQPIRIWTEIHSRKKGDACSRSCCSMIYLKYVAPAAVVCGTLRIGQVLEEFS